MAAVCLMYFLASELAKGEETAPITEAVIYILLPAGERGVGIGNVVGGPFVACFSSPAEWPRLDCYFADGFIAGTDQRITKLGRVLTVAVGPGVAQ